MLIIVLTAKDIGKLSCQFINEKGAILISDGHSISMRCDLNGMFLLDGALDGRIESDNDVLRLELPLSDVSTIQLVYVRCIVLYC